MSLSSSPQLIKGGLVVLDALSGAVKRTIALQYNPDTLTRSYQVQGVGGEGGGERAQPFRLKGPAIETLKLDAEIDATDSLEHPDQNANAVAFGIAPQLAALESLVNPSTRELLALNALSQWACWKSCRPRCITTIARGCDPFSSKLATPPSQGANKSSTTGGEK